MRKHMESTEAAIYLEDMLKAYADPSRVPCEYDAWDFERYASWFDKHGLPRVAAYYRGAWRPVLSRRREPYGGAA